MSLIAGCHGLDGVGLVRPGHATRGKLQGAGGGGGGGYVGSVGFRVYGLGFKV